MALKINDVITETCEGQRVESWFKLLDDRIAKSRNERIITDEEAEKVRELMVSIGGNRYMYIFWNAKIISFHKFWATRSCTCQINNVFFLDSQSFSPSKLI